MNRRCGNCAHANHEDGYKHPDPNVAVVFCTNRRSFHCGRAMAGSSCCAWWTEPDDEPPSDVLEQASREPGGESDGEREIRLLTERGGRVGGTW